MDKNFSKLVSARIVAALKERNVTQTELAQMIEKSRAYVSNIIKGRYLPKISELLKISEYLKKPISYFLGDDSKSFMLYSEKAKKWDKVVSLIDKEIINDFQSDVVKIPILDNSQLRGKTFDELIVIKNNATSFVYLSQSYIKEFFHYYKPLEDLAAVRTFIRSYPEFGIEIGDIGIYEPILNNDIKEESGKLYAIFYKGDVGIKRVYRDGKEYYFEPMHSAPMIDKISPNDPNLIIPGRIVFVIHTKMF